MNEPFILLLHGLGGYTESFIGLEKYLDWKGFKRVYKFHYLVDLLSFEECVDHVSDELEKIVKKDEKIIVIGQSMGGSIGSVLHTRGWNLDFLITIGSPLKGAALLKMLKKRLPNKIQDILHKPMYDDLITMIDEPLIEPPHEYHCFTMAWPLTKFDGCVYVDEAHFDKNKHTHLPFADHRTIFANPRLWWHVHNKLKDYLTI